MMDAEYNTEERREIEKKLWKGKKNTFLIKLENQY